MANYFESDLAKSESIRQELVVQCDSSLAVLQRLPDYKGNTEFRDAGIALFKFYAEMSKAEYKEMLDVLGKGAEIEMSDIERLTEIETELASREEPLDAKFQSAQQNFAKEHNLSLEENEMQKELDNLGK